MHSPLRRSMCGTIALASLIGARRVAAADAFPASSINIVVPYPPGGATDILSRMVAKRMSEMMRVVVVVENQSGAAGVIGTRRVAKAKADGYTLIATAAGQAVRMAFPQAGYDLRTDFAPLALMASVPNVILAHPSFPAPGLREFLQYCRSRPDEVRIGSTGTGGSAHLGLELLQGMANFRAVHVPYKGGAPGLADVVAGHIPVMIDALSTAGAFLQSGRLRAIAVTGLARSPQYPDTPTVAEAVPGYDAEGWYGLFGVAGTPPATLAVLEQTIDRILVEPEYRAKAEQAGAVLRPERGAKFGEFVAGEVAKWTKVVSDRKIVME